MRNKQTAFDRSRSRAASAVQGLIDRATADEQVHRIIAGSSGRSAIRCLADKTGPLTTQDKSAIFLEAARVIQSDVGGINLRNLTTLRKRRRLNLTR